MPADQQDGSDQPDMFDSGPAPKAARRPTSRGPRHQKGTRTLERLRDRIELAVKELHRLREENHTLHRELEAIRKHGLDAVEGTPVVFTDSSKSLRKQLEGFLVTIDRCISEAETESGADTVTDSEGP